MAECSDSSVTNKVIAQKQKTVIVPTDNNRPPKTEKVLLIEDIKEELFPQSYQNLLDELRKRNSSPSSEADVIVLFLYIMMLEESFIPLNIETDATSMKFNWSQVLELSTKIPPNWKRSNQLYEINFILSNYPKSVVRLIGTKVEDELIVNCVLKGVVNDGYSMLIDPRQYVVFSATNLRMRYQNIRQLAVSFKDKVSGLVKRDVLQVCSKLHDLPPEIFLLISNYVSMKNVDRALDD